MKKIVAVQGSYDLINWGHCRSLKLAKSYGDYLIVFLNSNKLLKSYKNREAVLPWYQKKFILESLKYVDKVIVANNFSPLKLLKKYKVDVYCLTKEWEFSKTKEIEYMKQKGGKIKFLPRFKGVVPTSMIKKILLQEAKDGYMK